MVYDLSLARYKVEVTVHLIIVEGTYAGRTQSKCFSREVQEVANRACFKMRESWSVTHRGGGGP